MSPLGRLAIGGMWNKARTYHFHRFYEGTVFSVARGFEAVVGWHYDIRIPGSLHGRFLRIWRSPGRRVWVVRDDATLGYFKTAGNALEAAARQLMLLDAEVRLQGPGLTLEQVRDLSAALKANAVPPTPMGDHVLIMDPKSAEDLGL